MIEGNVQLWIELEVESWSDCVLLFVGDNGCGMMCEQVDCVFDVFFLECKGGIGFGLVIVQ